MYVALRSCVPIPLSMMACLAFSLSSIRSSEIDIKLLYGEEPPSATAFDGSAPKNRRVPILPSGGIALLAMGLCLAAIAIPDGPLWSHPTEWLAHVACCTCISTGAGLLTARIALLFVASRPRYIDNYDLLLPDCGADDDYKRRIYFDHVTGISRLLGSAFILFASSRLLAAIPNDLGTVRVYGGIPVESSSVPGSLVHMVSLVNAAKGFGPTILMAFTAIALAKAVLRRWRFTVEWGIVDTSAHSEAFEDSRASSIRRAAILCCFCIVLWLGGTALSKALEDGFLAGVAVSGLMATVTSLAIKVLLEVVAGLAVALIVEHILTSKATYDGASMHFSLFDEFAEVCVAHDGLALMRRATFVLTLSSMAVSTMVLTSVVYHQPVTSWTGLAAGILKMLGVS